MKLSPLLLVASIAGNAALVALVVTHSPSGSESSSATRGARGTAAVAGTSGSSRNATTTATDRSGKTDAKLWSKLSAGDYAATAARLRAEGFPPNLVRAIVRSQIAESFSERRKALNPQKTDLPFWQPEPPMDPKVQKELRELGREERELVKQVLGNDRPDESDPMYAAYLRRQYGDLPREKIDQLTKVQQDYNELRNEIFTALSAGGGPVSIAGDTRDKLALLEKEQRKDIQQLLSPKEFEEYELRTSSTANNMRYQLSPFNPSEQEFRTIFALQKAFDDQYRGSQYGPGEQTREQMQQRSEAQKQLTQDIKAALGPERGADYERSIDGNFQQISRITQRLNLPQDAAVSVWNLQKETEQRVAALRQDRSLPPDVRNQQLSTLNAEVTAKVTAALGQSGYDAYKQYGGYWLQNIQPRTGPVNGTVQQIEGGRMIIRRD